MGQSYVMSNESDLSEVLSYIMESNKLSTIKFLDPSGNLQLDLIVQELEELGIISEGTYSEIRKMINK